VSDRLSHNTIKELECKIALAFGSAARAYAQASAVLDPAGPLNLGTHNATAINMGNVAHTVSLSATVQTGQVLSLSGAETDFIALGLVPAQSGYVRVGNGIAGTDHPVVVARDPTNTFDMPLVIVNGTNVVIGKGGIGETSIVFNLTPVVFDKTIPSPILAHAIQIADVACTPLTLRAQSPWSGAVTNINGGGLLLCSGDSVSNGVTGLRGFAALNLSHTTTQHGVEIAEVAVGQRVVGLAQFGSGVTSTNVPAGGGDGVVWVANAATNPTASAVGGFLMYGSGAEAFVRGSTVCQLTGAIALSGNAASSFTTSSGALTLGGNASIIVQVAGATIATWLGSGNGGVLQWAPATAVPPQLSQQNPTADAGGTVNFLIRAQNAFPGGATNINGAPVVCRGGAAATNGTTGVRGGFRAQLGNDSAETFIETGEVSVGQRFVALCQVGSGLTTTQLPANTGDGVVWVGNRQAAPSANSVGGGLLYSESGAGKWRGTGGTTTTFGAAEPHCPSCGFDFVVEWEADDAHLVESMRGSRLTLCVPCLLDALASKGHDVSQFAFNNAMPRRRRKAA